MSNVPANLKLKARSCPYVKQTGLGFYFMVLLCGFVFCLLPVARAKAEIIILSSPTYSKVETSVIGPNTDAHWPYLGLPPDYARESNILPIWSYYFTGKALVSKCVASGFVTLVPRGGCNLGGGSTAIYKMDVYADVVPGSNVQVKFQADLFVKWKDMPGATAEGRSGFSFNAVGVSSSASVDRSSTPLLTESSLSDNRQWVVAVKPPANTAYETGGKTYYKLGTLEITGVGGVPCPNTVVSAEYKSEITGIKAHYIGNALSVNDGDNQLWVVNGQLPKPLSVKVADGETGAAVSGVPITFTLVEPVNGAKFLNDRTSIAADTVDGIAAVKLILGVSSGTYKVAASCPADICTSGAKEITFTETAVTNEEVTELSIVQCDKGASINAQVRNAFIVRAFNTLTHKGEENRIVSFARGTFPAGAVGQAASPASAQTNPLGIAFGNIQTGDKTGEYVFTARCPSCQKNPGVSCSVRAGLPPKIEAVPPDAGPEAGDPSETPMLRISNIAYPNDRVSFTTYFGENNIQLAADLKPDTPEYNNLSGNIAWVVEDSPADAINSGNPLDPSQGAATNFFVNHPYVPAAEKGRQLPLKYRIQASVMTPKGLVKSYPRHIKQDDIDKCRQEYFDVSTAGNDLRVAPYFSQYSRPRFSPGTDGEFVKRSDCSAHIYPETRAQETVSLRNRFLGQFGITVTSGYRSARRNKQEGGVWNSVHQFGDAVDIQANPVNGLNMRKLWLESNCPKILEKMVYVTGSDGKKKKQFKQMLEGRCDLTGLRDWQNNLIEGEFTGNFDNLNEGRKNVNGNGTYDILEDLAPKNGVADIFDAARVVHLGD